MSKGRAKNQFRYIVGNQDLWFRRVNLHELAFSSPLSALQNTFVSEHYLFVYKRGRLVGCVELESFMAEWANYLYNKYPMLSPKSSKGNYRNCPAWVWDLDSSVQPLECRKLNAALLKAALGLKKPNKT